MQVLNRLKKSSTALHSIPIASYESIMRLVAKIFSYVQNHAPSMVTGIYGTNVLAYDITCNNCPQNQATYVPSVYPNTANKTPTGASDG